MKHRITKALFVTACAAGVALTPIACALMSKAELVEVRYFSPERVKSRRNYQAPAESASNPLQLRLGRVFSGPHLRERVAYHDSTYELGYYEDLRWTERPDAFVRRELARSLFETQGVRRVVGAGAPTLDVELLAFDELRMNTGRAARIQLRFALYEDEEVLLEETLTVDRPVAVAEPRIEDVVAAMSAALDAVAREVAVKVERALVARRSQAATDPPP